MRSLNNKKLASTLLLILFIVNDNICYSEDAYSYLTKPYEDRYREAGISYRKEFRDNVIYILPAREKSKDTVGEYIDKEGRKRFEENAEKEALETGEPVSYIMEGLPDEDGELEYFELPTEKKLVECIYPKGYTYPENCISDDGVHIFKAGRDPQEKLDEIARFQGKLSEYNKIPPNYDPDGCSVDEKGVEHPCEETTVVDMISKQDSQAAVNLNK